MDERSSERFWTPQVLVLLVISGLVLVAGWHLLWFLCDDAYIAFRYVSNSRLGHGYVWNPPPFQPVEGYSNFLWIVLLDLAWRATDVAPPISANVLSLFFSFLTLVLALRMAWGLRWRDDLVGVRMGLLWLVAAGLVTSRTFLTWSSSGLETALFNFLLLAWVYSLSFTPADGPRRVALVSSITAALWLTRPDGMLFAVATVVALALAPVLERKRASWSTAVAAAPLLLIPGHLAWRHGTYGQWLPNTYYAKVTGPWSECGLRYLASFVLEHAPWPWLALAACALVTAVPGLARGGASARLRAAFPQLVVGLTIAAHLAYYVLVVGGDHFEYRVFSHLVPLGLVSFLWLLNHSRLGSRGALAATALLVALSWPIPWTHHALARGLTTREETFKMHVRLAPHWPPGVRWYARAFDGLQGWLIEHFACLRRREHAVNLEDLKSQFPPRSEGVKVPSDGLPVLAFPAVGYPSWALPGVNVIDLHGLNDHVVARTPVRPGAVRMMAHERRAPAGYADCFRPNVRLVAGGGVRLVPRDPPLTAEDVRTCEATWRARVGR